MKKKWYFRIFVSALVLLVIAQQQTVVPNQEIVLEFVDIDVTSSEAQNAIAIVKKQLHTIGVKNAKVSKELENGKLKIAYYSDEDVAYIKKILAEAQNVEFSHVVYDHDTKDDSLPLDKKSKDFNLDVYEIQKGRDLEVDFNSEYVLVSHEQDGGFPSNSYSFISKIDVDITDWRVKVAEKVHTTIANAIDNTSFKIPEVRAGPIS